MPLAVLVEVHGGAYSGFGNGITRRDHATSALIVTARGTTDNGRLEITSRGSGRLTVGTASLMPADNILGWRADTIAMVEELDSPVYRWPGGNFVSGYDWKDGIGDPDQRPPRKNPAWKGVESNDVGLHEFMDLMREIDAEPFVAVNTGLGEPEAAAEQVELAVKTVSQKNVRVGIFTMDEDAQGYSEVVKALSVNSLPGVAVLSRGCGAVAVTGEITEAELLRAFVAASTAACSAVSGAPCCPAE